jgi:RNA-binding protein YhbY
MKPKFRGDLNGGGDKYENCLQIVERKEGIKQQLLRTLCIHIKHRCLVKINIKSAVTNDLSIHNHCSETQLTTVHVPHFMMIIFSLHNNAQYDKNENEKFSPLNLTSSLLLLPPPQLDLVF